MPPDTAPIDSPPEDAPVQSGRRSVDGPIGASLALSVVIHAVVLGIAMVVHVARPPVRVEFDPSEGVALMARAGLVPEYTPGGGEGESGADEGSGGPDEASEEPVVAPAPSDEPPEEAAQEAPAEEPRADEEPAPAIEAAPVPNPPEPGETIHGPRAPIADTPRLVASGSGDGPSGPDLSLPPSERYPEGTLNPIATDIGMWGPEGARIVLITRNDRIAVSAHRRNFESILASLPDWQSLVGTSEIDPFDDVDAMLIATSDPRYLSRTFLAAVHHLPDNEVIRALTGGFPGGVTWEERRGRWFGTPVEGERHRDPRIFVVPTRGLFIFTRPEYMEDLLHRAPRPRGIEDAGVLPEEPEPQEGSSDGGGEGDANAGGSAGGQVEVSRPVGTVTLSGGAERPRLRNARPRDVGADDEPPMREDGWIRGLRDLADFGGDSRSGPAMVLTAGGFSELRIEGLGRAAPPQAIHASLAASDDPVLSGRLIFTDRDEATAFVEAWPSILRANRPQLRLIGIYSTLEAAEWEVDFNEASFTITFPQDVVDRLAETVAVIQQGRLAE